MIYLYQTPGQSPNKGGRPKTKRYLPGSARKIAAAQRSFTGIAAPMGYGQGSQACRRCKEYGHNRRTCKAADQLQLFQAADDSMEDNADSKNEEDNGESESERDRETNESGKDMEGNENELDVEVLVQWGGCVG